MIVAKRRLGRVGRGKKSRIETEPTSEAGVLDGEWRADRRD